MKTVLIYVQDLLGSGHLRRMEILADTLAANGAAVTLLYGGMATPRCAAAVTTHRLPAVKTDAEFSRLLQANGDAVTPAFAARRTAQLLQVFASRDWDVLLIEMYPFGRRRLGFELLPLLEAATDRRGQTQKPLIGCSIRDILQSRSHARNLETCDRIKRYFDVVLVHGDAAFIPLGHSFPLVERLGDKLVYTGYITRHHRDRPQQRIPDNIIVSAGSGAAGLPLYSIALAAAQQPRGRPYQWHFLTGNNLEQAPAEALFSARSPNVRAEHNRADFRALLSRAGVSISQAGYNTVLDLLTTATPAVLVPFEGRAETEQLTRAARLAEAAQFTLLRAGDATPENLLDAVANLASNPAQPGAIMPNMRGAEYAAQWLLNR